MFDLGSRALASPEVFRRQVMRYGGGAALLLAVSLGVGVVGYHMFARLPWLDALVNA